jgi:ribosome biogenesis GTPase
MSHKITNRQLRALKKSQERQQQHRLRKEIQQLRQAELAGRRAPATRRRDWLDGEDAAPAFEKIRRIRTVPASPPANASPPDPIAEAVGTVIEVRSGDSLVGYAGRVLRGILPPGARLVNPQTRSPLAVGDRVQIEPISSTEVRIVAVLPRRSALVREVSDQSRRDAVHVAQVVAANIDQVVIVCTPQEPPFRPRLLDRYLVAASRDGLTPVICLNKTDLGVATEVEASLTGYGRLGIRIVRTSAATGAGVDELRACIAGGVSLFSGHSGVGKSSLLNALEPGLQLKVGQVTLATAGQGKGRHITSSARLVPLSLADTFVVDSPGIRSFGVRGLAPRELASHFVEVARLAGGCAYRDCLHRGEPGCAVEASAGHDWFLRARLESYRAMLKEVS